MEWKLWNIHKPRGCLDPRERRFNESWVDRWERMFGIKPDMKASHGNRAQTAKNGVLSSTLKNQSEKPAKRKRKKRKKRIVRAKRQLVLEPVNHRLSHLLDIDASHVKPSGPVVDKRD